MLIECYSNLHSSALNKISARIPDAREFIFSFNPEKPVSENAQSAFQNRWYGNATEDVCTKLTGHFNQRFNRMPGQIFLLRRFIHGTDASSFPVINHFYMLLADPYYRWAASEYLVNRFVEHRLAISVDSFAIEVRKHLPSDFVIGTSIRYARNILAALRDNGLLTGKVNKEIASPSISIQSLAYILYALSDWGIGVNEFDGSPVHLSMLKPRELFIPLFQEGERLGYWEFTGDRKRLSANLRMNGLKQWMEASSI